MPFQPGLGNEVANESVEIRASTQGCKDTAMVVLANVAPILKGTLMAQLDENTTPASNAGKWVPHSEAAEDPDDGRKVALAVASEYIAPSPLKDTVSMGYISGRFKVPLLTGCTANAVEDLGAKLFNKGTILYIP